MGRPARAVAAVLALGIGGGVAYLTRRPDAVRQNPRPAAVERVVKALDRFSSTNRGEFETALAAAGSPTSFDSPWREELELARLVLEGDRAAIEAFAKASPPSPARARAWLRLSLDGPREDQRTAALDALRETYPDSAAARVYGARASRSSK